MLDFPETLIRIGIVPKTEFRLTAPDYYRDAPSGSGFGDLTLGVKQQLGKLAGLDLAAVASLSVPTGSNALSSHGYDPSFNLAWSRSLAAGWNVGGMLSLYAPTIDGSRTVYGESTFLLDRQLTKPWDVFAEYLGDFPQAGGPRHLLHFGTAYKVSPHQQLDFHVGVGLSSATADNFVGAGYSFNIRAGR